jgi:hypothetical protein
MIVTSNFGFNYMYAWNASRHISVIFDLSGDFLDYGDAKTKPG